MIVVIGVEEVDFDVVSTGIVVLSRSMVAFDDADVKGTVDVIEPVIVES